MSKEVAGLEFPALKSIICFQYKARAKLGHWKFLVGHWKFLVGHWTFPRILP